MSTTSPRATKSLVIPVRASWWLSTTIRSASRYGSGRRSTASKTLNTARVAPSPRASVATAAKVKLRSRARARSDWRIWAVVTEVGDGRGMGPTLPARAAGRLNGPAGRRTSAPRLPPARLQRPDEGDRGRQRGAHVARGVRPLPLADVDRDDLARPD